MGIFRRLPYDLEDTSPKNKTIVSLDTDEIKETSIYKYKNTKININDKSVNYIKKHYKKYIDKNDIQL